MQIRKNILVSIAAILFSFQFLNAQNVRDLIISEATVDSDTTGIIDGFGERSGWIELFNTSQGTVNFGGCFLSDDKNDLKKNIISKSDLKTKIGPRQAVLFFANGKGEQGTFYVNFKITRGSTIYLTSNDGRTIIDSLTIPNNLPVGKSVSKIAKDAKQIDFQVAKEFTDPTPGVPNGNINEETRSQKMEREDPYGLILTLVSVSVVFFALIMLWLIFASLFSKARRDRLKARFKKSDNNEMTPEVAAAISMALDQEFSGETYAAIGMALHQYMEDTVHDNESFILTIRNNENTNWNNKVQNFRKLPR